MITRRFLIAALVLGGSAIPASANLVTYTSLSSFQTATSADVFSNITFAQGNLGTSVTEDGVEFDDSKPMTGVEDEPGWPSGSTGVSTPDAPGSTITLTIPNTIGAIGFYVYGSDAYVSVTDNSGGSYSNGTALAQGFFGITTDSNFVTFTISNDNGNGVLDIGDISAGQAETPEVATLLLVATGLLLMGGVRRRTLRRKQRHMEAQACVTPA